MAAGLWSKIGAEYKDAPKKLQQNTTTTVRSRNSMANGLVLKEKHIHSIDLNNIPMFLNSYAIYFRPPSLAGQLGRLSRPSVEAVCRGHSAKPPSVEAVCRGPYS